MAEPKKQVCRVMITFPLVDNMTALATKDSLDKMFADIPDANVQFVIMNVPNARNISQPQPLKSQ